MTDYFHRLNLIYSSLLALQILLLTIAILYREHSPGLSGSLYFGVAGVAFAAIPVLLYFRNRKNKLHKIKVLEAEEHYAALYDFSRKQLFLLFLGFVILVISLWFSPSVLTMLFILVVLVIFSSQKPTPKAFGKPPRQ